MRITQRQVSLSIMALLAVGSMLIFFGALLAPTGNLLSSGVATVLFVIVLVVYWRGWERARYVVIVLTAFVTAVFMPTQPVDYLTQNSSFSILLPSLLALIMGGPLWIFMTGLFVPIALVVRSLIVAGQAGIYASPELLIVYGLIISGLILGRLVTDTAQRRAEENALRAEEARARSDDQANELSRRANDLSAQNEQQRRLLDLVATLETPAVTLADGVLLAPVVGHLDSRRAQALTDRLLHAVSTQRARMVILDISGVSAVDTAVAQSLMRAVQALRLLGCTVTITGISAAVAATMTELGINMTGVHTARTPQEALARSTGPSAGVGMALSAARGN